SESAATPDSRPARGRSHARSRAALPHRALPRPRRASRRRGPPAACRTDGGASDLDRLHVVTDEEARLGERLYFLRRDAGRELDQPQAFFRDIEDAVVGDDAIDAAHAG